MDRGWDVVEAGGMWGWAERSPSLLVLWAYQGFSRTEG